MGEVSDEVIFQVFQVFQVLDGLLNDGDVIHNQLWGNEQVVLCVYKFPHWCWRKVDVEHLSLCLALNDGLYIEFSCLNPVFGVIHLGGHWIDEVSHLLRRVWIFKFHTLQATFVENANAPLWQSLRGIFTLQVFLDRHCYGIATAQCQDERLPKVGALGSETTFCNSPASWSAFGLSLPSLKVGLVQRQLHPPAVAGDFSTCLQWQRRLHLHIGRTL